MINYDNFVHFYESTFECNQAIRNMQNAIEIDFNYSPLFNTYENMGWYYACLFTNDKKEQEVLEHDFWEMIEFLINYPDADRNSEYEEIYYNLLLHYGDKEELKKWRDKEKSL